MLPLFFGNEYIARLSDRELVAEYQQTEVESEECELLMLEMERRRIIF